MYGELVGPPGPPPPTTIGKLVAVISKPEQGVCAKGDAV